MTNDEISSKVISELNALTLKLSKSDYLEVLNYLGDEINCRIDTVELDIEKEPAEKE